MKKLAIFDIDGTLTHTNEVDGLSFAKAWQDLYQISDLSTDWASYQYSSDSGIFDEIFRERFDRSSTDSERNEFVRHFISCLKEFGIQNPLHFREVPNAGRIFSELAEKASDWKIAIATGAWAESGRFKLEKSKIPYQGVPFASAESAFDRKEIIQTAWQRAREIYDQDFDRVVYIGDGIWDLKSSSELKIHFVGLDITGQSSILRRQNPSHILPHYENFSVVLEALEKALVPAYREF